MNRQQIYTRVKDVKEIVTLLKEIEAHEKRLEVLFDDYKHLEGQEQVLLESWHKTLQDVSSRLDKITQ